MISNEEEEMGCWTETVLNRDDTHTEAVITPAPDSLAEPPNVEDFFSFAWSKLTEQWSH